jgi:hypothetical protein
MAGKQIVTKDHWSKYAEEYAKNEVSTGAQFLSTRNGQFKLGDEDLGTQLCVVVADAVFENTYYEGRFNAKEKTPPRCYAFGRSPDELEPGFVTMPDGKERDLFLETDPKEEFFEAQNDACEGCPMAEWGTSDTGRGKACQNRRRLAVIPAGVYVFNKKSKEWVLEIFDDPADISAADMAYVKVPPTSTRVWAKYVKELNGMGRPPFGVLTRMALVPSEDNQFEFEFELIEEIEDDEMVQVVMDRHEEARATIYSPYRPPEPDSAQSVQGLKKKKRAR